MLIKTITDVALILGLVLSWGLLPAAAVPTLSIVPASQAVPPGQSLALDVNIVNVTDLFSFQFDLAFTPGVLSATSITEGRFLPSGGATVFIPGTIDNVGSTITFTADSLIGPPPGVSGSGTLATVDFRALALGTSLVTLTNVILLDSSLGDITASTIEGSITVRQAVTGVPEPAAWLLLATGCVGLFGYGWRQRQRAV
jgi:hypothetical protein